MPTIEDLAAAVDQYESLLNQQAKATREAMADQELALASQERLLEVKRLTVAASRKVDDLAGELERERQAERCRELQRLERERDG